MGKKRNLIWSVLALLVPALVIFFIDSSQNRFHDIKKAVHSLEQPSTQIAQIHKIDSDTAIVFYKWGNGITQQFGYVSLNKNLLGWKISSRKTNQLPPNRKLGWQHTTLPIQGKQSLLIYGRIIDPKINKVVLIHNSKHYEANIVSYGNGERFWYKLSNPMFTGYLVTGLSKDGTILEAH